MTETAGSPKEITGVHPVAALFPRRSEAELRMMAADIQQRGLIYPLLIDKDGMLLDGRHRLAACEIADVPPRFETYDGDDPEGFILAVNGQRRDLTQGQRAIIAAQSFNLKDVYQDGRQSALARAIGVRASDVSKALTITKFAPPELVASVIAGGKFDPAYKTALEAKKAADQAEDDRASLPSDLAALVKSGHRTLADAKAETEHRDMVAEIDKIVAGDGERPYADRVAEGSLSWQEAADLASRWRAERLEAHERNRGSIREFLRALSVTDAIIRQVQQDPGSAYTCDMLGGLTERERAMFAEAIDRLGEADE